MAHTVSLPSLAASAAPAREFVQGSVTPWYLWCSVAAVTSAMVGLHWDISWHMSIGRDSFLTPAHLAIYLCGVLAGVSCGYLILATTFGLRQEGEAATVRMWGFRGPVGAFLAAWGGVAMLTSAPFDDWWHGAYGLDVKVLSPPHMVLASGIVAILGGALILILGYMNRAQHEDAHRRFRAIFLYTGGMLLILAMVISLEMTWRVYHHNARFYGVVAGIVPVILLAVSRTARGRFPATAAAGLYTVFGAAMIWILPLFPAEPKLGPVYQKVTHFVPLEFPLLLLIPALALDLLRPRIEKWNPLLQAAVCGAVFVSLFLAVQWPFADFLLSPASRNRIFGTAYLAYSISPMSTYARHLFSLDAKTAAEFWQAMPWPFGIAMISSWMGLKGAAVMQRLQR